MEGAEKLQPRSSLFPSRRRKQLQQYFISPHNYYNRKRYKYMYIQQMIWVLAARNNLKVKNARQPAVRKDIQMLRSETQEQTHTDTHKNENKQS